MTRLAIIFSLLFVTPAWAGEVDGNSFFCSNGGPPSQDRAILFKNDKVKYWIYGVSLSTHYIAFDRSVGWSDNVAYYALDRKTLEYSELSKKRLPEIRLKCRFMDFSEAINLIKERDKRRSLNARKGNQF